MEAPKYEQLLKVVEEVNPSWYPFIYGYLNGELENLEIDNEGYDPEYDTGALNIGNNDRCVVGEVFGFNRTYRHDKFNDCFICGQYAQELFDNSNDQDNGNELEVEDQRIKFAEILRDFYVHRGFMK